MPEYHSVLGELMLMCIDFMRTEFDLLGYTVSYWQMFIFEAIAGVVCLLVRGFLD